MRYPPIPLGDIFNIARGGSPRPIEKFITDDEDGVNWISISDASDSSKYITKTARKIHPSGVSRSRRVVPGDFLLTNSMSFGRPYIMATEGCIHDGWLMLSPRKPNVHSDFMYHVLGSPLVYSEFARLAAGATVKNLNIDLVSRVEVPFPPLAEQRRTAAILDQADALRRKRREALERLDELRRSVFDEIFGDPVLNPKKWKRKKAEELCDRITVGIVVKPASYYREQGIPAIRGTNIKSSGIDLSDVVFFSEEDNSTKLSKTRIWNGDLVIVRSGRPGLTAVVPKELHGANSIDVLIVTPKTSEIRPQFLRDFLNSDGGKRIVLAESRGQIQQHFNVRSLSEALIYAPPLGVQDRYVHFLSRIDDLAARATSSELELDALFTSLQYNAFRGEL